MRNYLEILERLVLPIAILAVGPGIAAAKLIIRRWGTGPAREWPTISATIDVVSVVEEIREGRYDTAQTTGYTAALTYFYRNPDLQMGEYHRFFQLEAAARVWAEQFKGRHIPVHVNPKDPSDSVLIKSDLEALAPQPVPSLEDSLRMERFPRLRRGYLLLSVISELVSFLGIGVTSIALWTGHGHTFKSWVICLLVFNFASTWIVTFRADESGNYRAVIHSPTLFCPAWMRWGVNLTGSMLLAFWLGVQLRDMFPDGANHLLTHVARYWSYLFAFWGFFSTGATNAAILRSQELTRLTNEDNIPTGAL